MLLKHDLHDSVIRPAKFPAYMKLLFIKEISTFFFGWDAVWAQLFLLEGPVHVREVTDLKVPREP